MATNERVINRSANDGTMICRFAECLQEPPTDGGYLCSNLIFTTYDSARGITPMTQKWLDKLTDMILDTVTLKRGKNSLWTEMNERMKVQRFKVRSKTD